MILNDFAFLWNFFILIITFHMTFNVYVNGSVKKQKFTRRLVQNTNFCDKRK